MNFSKRSFTLIIISLALIAGCSGQPAPIGSTPTPAADAPLTATATTISASGEVVPAQWTTLSFSQAGTIVELPVKEGDRVKAGDLIAQLDAIDLKASLLQKQAAVQTAEAQLAQLTATPRPDEIEAAQQAVEAAQDRVAAATAQRNQMRSSIAEADITQAQTQVYAAQVQLDKLNESMDKIIDIGGFALSAGESLDNYIKYTELQRAAAQSALDELLRGPTPNQLRVANARIALANAEVDAAQARLNLLQAGPLAQDVAVAQAKVDQAKADEAAVQAQIDQTQARRAVRWHCRQRRRGCESIRGAGTTDRAVGRSRQLARRDDGPRRKRCGAPQRRRSGQLSLSTPCPARKSTARSRASLPRPKKARA